MYIYITVTAVMCVHSTDHHMQVPVAAQCHVFSERRMTLSDWPWMCLCLESCHFKLSEERVSGGCYAECCDVARVVVYWKELKKWFWSFCSVTSVWRAAAALAVVMNQKCRRDCSSWVCACRNVSEQDKTIQIFSSYQDRAVRTNPFMNTRFNLPSYPPVIKHTWMHFQWDFYELLICLAQ